MDDRQIGRQTILLLVGPKGAGKTTIGTMIEKGLGIPFLRVEPIYLEAMRSHPELKGPELEPIGFGAIIEAVTHLLASSAGVVLETTATAGYTPLFIERLEERGRLLLVRVTASDDLCVERVRRRDRSGHIPVSDDRVREINAVARSVALPWHLEIDNESPLEEGALLRSIGDLLTS